MRLGYERWNLTICSDVDGPRGCEAEWNEPDKGKYHLSAESEEQNERTNGTETGSWTPNKRRAAGRGRVGGLGGGGEDREARTGTYSAVTGSWRGARGIRSGPLITPDGAGGDEARRGDRALSHVNV